MSRAIQLARAAWHGSTAPATIWNEVKNHDALADCLVLSDSNCDVDTTVPTGHPQGLREAIRAEEIWIALGPLPNMDNAGKARVANQMWANTNLDSEFAAANTDDGSFAQIQGFNYSDGGDDWLDQGIRYRATNPSGDIYTGTDFKNYNPADTDGSLMGGETLINHWYFGRKASYGKLKPIFSVSSSGRTGNLIHLSSGGYFGNQASATIDCDVSSVTEATIKAAIASDEEFDDLHDFGTNEFLSRFSKEWFVPDPEHPSDSRAVFSGLATASWDGGTEFTQQIKWGPGLDGDIGTAVTGPLLLAGHRTKVKDRAGFGVTALIGMGGRTMENLEDAFQTLGDAADGNRPRKALQRMIVQVLDGQGFDSAAQSSATHYTPRLMIFNIFGMNDAIRTPAHVHIADWEVIIDAWEDALDNLTVNSLPIDKSRVCYVTCLAQTMGGNKQTNLDSLRDAHIDLCRRRDRVSFFDSSVFLGRSGIQTDWQLNGSDNSHMSSAGFTAYWQMFIRTLRIINGEQASYGLLPTAGPAYRTIGKLIIPPTN